jgi:hypothetical protein
MMFVTREYKGKLKYYPERLNKYLSNYQHACYPCKYPGTIVAILMPDCKCREVALIKELETCWIDDK